MTTSTKQNNTDDSHDNSDKKLNNPDIQDKSDKDDKVNVESVFYYAKKQSLRIHRRCRKFWQDEKVCEKLNHMTQFMLSNPLLLFICTIVIALFVVPIALFTTFVIINVAITFSSFMIIEVSLVTIGLTTLSCIMFFIVAAIVVTGISLILSFYATYFSFMIVKNKVYSK